jgi:hypothetical protein
MRRYSRRNPQKKCKRVGGNNVGTMNYNKAWKKLAETTGNTLNVIKRNPIKTGIAVLIALFVKEVISKVRLELKFDEAQYIYNDINNDFCYVLDHIKDASTPTDLTRINNYMNEMKTKIKQSNDKDEKNAYNIFVEIYNKQLIYLKQYALVKEIQQIKLFNKI